VERIGDEVFNNERHPIVSLLKISAPTFNMGVPRSQEIETTSFIIRVHISANGLNVAVDRERKFLNNFYPFNFADVFLYCNPECREDEELCSWIDEMAAKNFSSRRRYRKRFRNDDFLKRSNLLEEFPMITFSLYRKYALDLTHLLSPRDCKRLKKLYKQFDDDQFRFSIAVVVTL
jgi:hypothetical protein